MKNKGSAFLKILVLLALIALGYYLVKQFFSVGDESFTVNGVTFNMIKVEGGSFTKGTGNTTRQVSLTDYSIGETEVTQELWEAVMGNNPSFFTRKMNYTDALHRPVERVTWHDCQTFINKLNKLTGKRFRLPTEDEWEFAARGGNKSQGYKYAGSNRVEDVAWYNGYTTFLKEAGSESRKYGTHAVATKVPNELRIYDMSGNVWEWCENRNVGRGGSWVGDAESCSIYSSTDNADHSLMGLELGFRLAL